MRRRSPVRAIALRPIQFLTPLASILVGCVRPDVSRPEQAANGCIFMLPGVEGTTWQFAGTIKGLREAGVDQSIRAIQWGKHPFRQMHNLCSYHLNRERAGDIAGQIARYRAEYPDAPVTLIGYSGGGGMAVLVVEALSENVKLDRLILIAAAVSPGYNLERIMPRVQVEVVNYYSRRDWAILGLGTRLFGTIDRHKISSAGRVGFLNDEESLIELPRLLQVSWHPDWRDLGHHGGHTGWLTSRWAKEVLAPRIAESPPKSSDEVTMVRK